MKVKDMSETVKTALALRDGQLKEEAWEMRGNNRKKWKNNEARRNFLPFVWEQRENIRGKLCTHSKPKYQSWAEVTAQQTLGRLENTFFHTFGIVAQHYYKHLLLPFWKKRPNLCYLPCFSVGKTPSWGKAVGDAAGLGCQPTNRWCSPWGAQCRLSLLAELWRTSECDAGVWSSFLGLGATKI